MTEYFIVANSCAAPFFSDQSTRYVKAETPDDAIAQFTATYTHPAGLYAADCYGSADDYNKGAKRLARWLSQRAIKAAAIEK